VKNLNWAQMNSRAKVKADTEAVLLYDFRIDVLDIMKLWDTLGTQ